MYISYYKPQCHSRSETLELREVERWGWKGDKITFEAWAVQGIQQPLRCHPQGHILSSPPHWTTFPGGHEVIWGAETCQKYSGSPSVEHRTSHQGGVHNSLLAFPGWWLREKEPACQCRRRTFDPWVGKIPWRRAWQPQDSCLENSTDREAWQTTVHRVTKSQTRLQQLSTCTHTHTHTHKHLYVSGTVEAAWANQTSLQLVI